MSNENPRLGLERFQRLMDEAIIELSTFRDDVIAGAALKHENERLQRKIWILEDEIGKLRKRLGT